MGISLKKIYSNIPAKELKRRAANGDELAALLYRAVGYGMNLQVLLWAIIGICAAGFFVLTARFLPSWLAFLGSIALLWFGFAWLPNTRVTRLGNEVARRAAPILAAILNKLYPLTNKISQAIRKNRYVAMHTGLFQREDLLELLDKQARQTDNRITADELSIAKHALQFGDKTIQQTMTPKRVVRTVDANEPIGPLLMDDLHKSGFSRFPVMDGEQIIGTLFLRDLVGLKGGGKVRDHIKKRVYYVNESQPLAQVLAAFLKTKHHLFIVVNEFEETVGIITIEDVIEQVLGKRIIDEFDNYDDMRAVAAQQAKQDKKNHKHAVEDGSAAATKTVPTVPKNASRDAPKTSPAKTEAQSATAKE